MNEVTLALFIIFFMWTMWPLAASKTTTFIQTAADTDPSLFSVYIKRISRCSQTIRFSSFSDHLWHQESTWEGSNK